MSAGALIGEQVAVLGQGLIGLLTAAVLQQSSYSDVDLPCITAVVRYRIRCWNNLRYLF